MPSAPGAWNPSRTPWRRLAANGLLHRSRLGEAEAIAFASTRDLRLIVDDKEARSMAVAAGVKIVGTAGALLEACLGAHLDPEEPETALPDLVQCCELRQPWLLRS